MITNKNIKKALIILSIALLSVSSLLAQNSQVAFGKNRLQHKEFKWKSINTQHFKIYYYNGGSSLAHEAAKFCEKSYEQLSKNIGFQSRSQISLLIYNSIIDLQQSNIGLESPNFVGGRTNLIKAKIEIGFNGSHIDFQKELKKEAANLLINQMMYGGTFKEMVQASYLLNLPDWFSGGAALFVAEGWSTEMEFVVRDVVQNRKGSINKLSGQEAIVAGQSFWNYLSITYGKGIVSNILNLARITRNHEEAITSAIGAPFEVILNGWKQFYRSRISSTGSEYHPSKKNRIQFMKLRPYSNYSIAYNPDSTLIAFGENFKGRLRVTTYNYLTGRRKVVFHGSYRLINQKVNYRLPLLSWKNSKELSIVFYKKGKAHMITKNIKNGKREKKTFSAFEDIRHISYSTISDEMAISAVQNGQSDLYIYDHKNKRVRKITKDIYGDFSPQFIPGTRKVVWASNRLNDTIEYSAYDYNSLDNHYNLFVYDVAKQSTKLEQISDANISVKQVIPINENEFYILGEFNKLNQIYKLDIERDTIIRVSNFSNSIKSFSLGSDMVKVFYTFRSKAKDYVMEENAFTIFQEHEGFSRFKPVTLAKEEQLSLHERIQKLNIGNFLFSSDSNSIDKYKEEEKIALEKKRKGQSLIKFPRQYDPLMGVDYIVGSLVIDQLRGPAILFDFGTSEMFGNHKFSGYTFLVTDLKSSSFGLMYELLKFRNDYRLKYDRYSLHTVSNDFIVQRYTKNDFELEASRPITATSRVSVAPFYTTTRFTNFNAVEQDDIVKNYTGLKLKYILDNTETVGTNMIIGSRGIIKLEGYKSLDNSAFDFNKFVMDFRTYKKIYRQMVIAARGSYGNFFGNSPKNFMLGGMDNWFFSNTNYQGQENPLVISQNVDNSDILFHEFTTSMRGFQYNELYGQQYLLLNLEARLPIARMLYAGPIGSSFLRALQVIGFYDIGSAWNGATPFSENNSLNTNEVGNTDGLPFEATVVNYLNPFISSFGFGARSMIYGYYVKADLAWGVKNYVVKSPMLHVTLGYDF